MKHYPDAPGSARFSETSREAARALIESQPTLQERVLEYVRDRTKGNSLLALRDPDGVIELGTTDVEIERALDLPHQTASARRRELVLQGKVRPLVDENGKPITRVNVDSGRRQTVWVVGRDPFIRQTVKCPRCKGFGRINPPGGPDGQLALPLEGDKR